MKYLFSLLIVVTFFACGDDPLPEGLIISDGLPETTLLDIATTFDNSTINIDWVGNEFALSYRYKLESLSYPDEINRYSDWSQWDSLTSVTLSYLDEGIYNFYIKSRYTTDVEEAEKSTQFTVDAITGPALRVYPLYQQVKTGESCDIYIYAEDVGSLAGIELNLTYSAFLLTFNSLTQGTSLLNTSFFVDETSASDGIGVIDIIALAFADEFNSNAGSNSLVKLTLTANQYTQDDILIINSNSILRDSNNDPIDIDDNIINGIIEIVQ